MDIKKGFPTPPKDYYKVYVRSITYNQASYIEDTLTGVAMQETDFPFVHHVIDDASTDGEQDIIKAWMEKECDMAHAEYYDNDACTITIVKNKKNSNCTLAVYFLKRNLYKEKAAKLALFNLWREICHYEALCEGDDYWIDPNKLQKQVDYLDSHHDVVYVCSRFNKLYQNTGKLELEPNSYFDEINPAATEFEFDNNYNFKVQWVSKTLTCMFRIDSYDPSFQQGFKYSRDVHMVYNILLHGKGVCFSNVMGVYRLNAESTFGGLPPVKRMEISYAVYNELWEKTRDKFWWDNAIEAFGTILYAYGFRIPHSWLELCSYRYAVNLKFDGLRRRLQNDK